MKKDIHPKYNHNIKVTCVSCGFSFVTGSTIDGNINVEICSHCHPYYTGVARVVDSENLIKKFENRQAKAEEKAKSKSFSNLKKKQAKAKETTQQSKPTNELTLKDMLAQLNS